MDMGREKAMSDLTIRLVYGKDWVTILPFGNSIGEVVDGTAFRRGDWVARPEWLTWKEATETDPQGNTLIGPQDLELVSDAVTGQVLTAESDQEAVKRAAETEGVVEEVWMAEEIARLLNAEEAGRKTTGHRRRKSDRAA